MSKARIIINLGAPTDFSESAAERFLRQFLSDPFILPFPTAVRRLLAGFIARRRARRYLDTARRIAVRGEFPLVAYTRSLADKVSAMSGERVYAAFRYGRDSIADVVARLSAEGCDFFDFVPMYPQNSLSMTQSAKAAVAAAVGGKRFSFRQSYCDHPLYIEALAENVRRVGDDPLILSFHSVPISQTRGSPYAAECETTARLLIERLGCGNALLGWQSKMGRGRWLEPSTRSLLRKLARRGAEGVSVVCPAFSCDCAETLSEIAEESRSYFLEYGGKRFNYCPCLNDSDKHAELFCELFEEAK